MHHSDEVYPVPEESIWVLFDCEDRKQVTRLEGFAQAFGERYWNTEALYGARHLCLHLYQGGACGIEVQA